MSLVRRLTSGLRWRLGFRVAAPQLEQGTDDSITEFYSARVTDCRFLGDPDHYESPRVRWILDKVRSGSLLEVGCGNVGMTCLIAPQVERVVALDVSTPSIEAMEKLGLQNVEPVRALVERFEPDRRFDWIVMSEVIEHLRRPSEVVRKLVGQLEPGGSLVLTTPNGHWESDEHLHVFSFTSLAKMLSDTSAETLSLTYLRDAKGRRRWLGARLVAAVRSPAESEFNSRRTITRERRLRARIAQP